MLLNPSSRPENEEKLLTDGTDGGAAPVPPAQNQTYTVDLSFNIRPDGGNQYVMDIQSKLWASVRGKVPISISLLKSLNASLNEAMEEVVTVSSAEALSPRAAVGARRALAEAGHFAFTQVFGDADLAEAIEAIQSDPSRRLNIDIHSEGFSLPWELLYPGDVSQESPEETSYERFWGFNHIISRLMTQRRRLGRSLAFPHPVITYSSKPNLGLLTNIDLPSVFHKEIPYFRQLEADGKIALTLLRDLDGDDLLRVSELQALSRFWDAQYDLAHFACHAVHEEKKPEMSYIWLSKEFPVTMQDISNYKWDLKGYPLVILNACETGNPSPQYALFFAGQFIDRGARGVVASEGKVPDDFAADFASHLYHDLLAEKELGESLMAARRHFLKKDNNPSGLLYAMYAPPSIRLAKI